MHNTEAVIELFGRVCSINGLIIVIGSTKKTSSATERGKCASWLGIIQYSQLSRHVLNLMLSTSHHYNAPLVEALFAAKH